MKKHIKTILGIIFALVLCGNIFAQIKPNPESDFKLITLKNGEHAYAYVGKSENVVIPKKIAGSYISANLFGTSNTEAEIKSVVIPEGVTTIGGQAFYYCSSLTSITIPSTVTEICDKAFEGCESLVNVTIPEGVTYIGEGAFRYCSSLTEISIPPSVTEIGAFAFYKSGISTIIFSSDGQIAKFLFTYYRYDDNENRFNLYESSLDKFNTTLKNVIILEGVTSIPRAAFIRCKGLTSITIPSTVTKIGARAFYGCESLVNVTIPESVTSIDEEAFCACSSLKEISIPNSVTNIGKTAFHSCKSLTSIDIPNSVTNIGEEAFCACSSLKEISIPNSVTNIGKGAFRSCKSLTSIDIPDSVTSINREAFYSCESLTSIDIPNSVTNIGEEAFQSCTSLEKIEFQSSDNALIIENSAFSGCYSLKTLIIPGNIMDIGDYAFSTCQNLTEVIFLDPLPYESVNFSFREAKYYKDGFLARFVHYDAFSGSRSLKKIILPKKNYINRNTDGRFACRDFEFNKTTFIYISNPFENQTLFTPHTTKGEMNITSESYKYNDQTYTALCISGNTETQKSDLSDYWEASCIANSEMKKFIQNGNNISFKALGDGNVWKIRFVLNDNGKKIYYDYEFSTKKDKLMAITIPYKKLNPVDKSVKHKFKKEEICDIIISGNNPGQKADRSIKIFDVKVY